MRKPQDPADASRKSHQLCTRNDLTRLQQTRPIFNKTAANPTEPIDILPLVKYFWGQLALFGSASSLSIMRSAENYHLFVLGLLALAAWLGRTLLRRRRPHWARLHIAGMGSSYVLMLIAFYVDNGKQSPLWRDLPHFMYWLLPLLVGLSLILHAMLQHPLARRWRP